jgi:hypothetical protein
MHLLRGGREAAGIDNGDKSSQEIGIEVGGHAQAPHSSQKTMSPIKLIRWINPSIFSMMDGDSVKFWRIRR